MRTYLPTRGASKRPTMAEVPAPSSITVVVVVVELKRLRCVERGFEAEEIQVAKRGVIRHVTLLK